MNFDKKALVGFITEIEASRDRAKGETRHQSEIFKKAREKGFEPKAMRQVLQRRAMKAGDRERMDELLDLYEHAMGALAEAVEAVQGGMSAREASERFGVPRGSLGAVVSGTKNAIFEPAHDADGVVTETQEKNDGENKIAQSAGQEAALCGQSDSGDVGTGPLGSGGLCAGQDDAGEDGGGFRGIGAAQDQLNNPAPQGSFLPGPPEANEVGASFSKLVPDGGVGAGNHPSERVAPPTDAEALDALDKSWEALKAARARRQTEGVGA